MIRPDLDSLAVILTSLRQPSGTEAIIPQSPGSPKAGMMVMTSMDGDRSEQPPRSEDEREPSTCLT